MPDLSVLVPVRNARPWLDSSLASLWRQTFREFEVIALDDGSSDGSGERLDQLARRESRLRVVHTPPRGLPAALNLALAHAHGRLIARHDADDLSHRERFTLQRAHLATHRALAVVGTRVRLFPAARVGAGMRRWVAWHNALLDHDAIAAEMLIDSPLAHGSAMMRRGALERVGGWAERGWPEDLDLWVRSLAAGLRFGKCPEVLYGWRQHAGSATRTDPRYARERFDALRLEALAHGLLTARHAVTAIGVGDSLSRWRRLLARGGRPVLALAARRPSPAVLTALAAPAVLVFGAVAARARWRAALVARGWQERVDFVFVA